MDPVPSEKPAFEPFILPQTVMKELTVRAVLVGTVGRLGDMFGRVRIYNAGFLVFTVASLLLSFDPSVGWLDVLHWPGAFRMARLFGHVE